MAARATLKERALPSRLARTGEGLQRRQPAARRAPAWRTASCVGQRHTERESRCEECRCATPVCRWTHRAPFSPSRRELRAGERAWLRGRGARVVTGWTTGSGVELRRAGSWRGDWGSAGAKPRPVAAAFGEATRRWTRNEARRWSRGARWARNLKGTYTKIMGCPATSPMMDVVARARANH